MGLDSREQDSKYISQEWLKFGFLSLAFFLVIAGYTIIKDIKDSIFVSIVGKTYQPLAKMGSMLFIIPLIVIYSILVDKIRRYQLLMVYTAAFGFIGLICAYYLGHPVIGLANTNSSPLRFFGWIIFFLFEGYSPFVVSVFWAFTNSISSPQEAKTSYPFIVAASKIGGMLSAGITWYLFAHNETATYGSLADVQVHQQVLLFFSFVSLCVPIVVYFLMKNVSGRYLHGYEAAYQAEKEKKKEDEVQDTSMPARFFASMKKMFSGIILLIKYPYVMGIFGMVYFYEVVTSVLSYLRLGVAQENSLSVSQISAFLFKMTFIMHAVGLVLSLIGTSTLLKWLGEKTCLLLIPVLSGILLLYLMIATTPFAVMCAFVALKAINYAFAWPVRESLYIPTVKDIKFKSKSWIDSFGSKFGKSSGSAFNIFASHLGTVLNGPLHSFFFAGIVAMWFIVALFLGIRFDRAVARNEVIGLEDTTPQSAG